MATEFLRASLGILAIAPLVESHAYLMIPAARSLADNNCPHCGQGGGPNTVKTRVDKWPTHGGYGGHGLCGDPFQGEEVTDFASEHFLNKVTDPKATYESGGIAEIVIGISTHHRGHFSFRLCNKVIDKNIGSAKEGQDCLDEHVLQRVPPEDAYSDCKPNDSRGDCQPVDPEHPGRWYLPPTAMYEERDGISTAYTMKYFIPEDFTCEKCTLQWYWATGNTCIYDEGYFNYFKNVFPNAGWSGADTWSQFGAASWANMGNSGCATGGTFGEEFWNCADIKVKAGGGGGGYPTPRPTPRPRPTPSSRPTPTPTPIHRECAAWCQKPPVDWEQKCGWPWCNGCNKCPTGPQCEEWCARPPASLAEKCSWTYCNGCDGCGSVEPEPESEPEPTPRPTPTPTPTPTPGGGGGGGDCRSQCGTVTGTWRSSMKEFEGNDDFCNCGFGGSCGFICGGGVDGGSGGQCPAEACTSGQYTFEDDTWTISVTQAQAKGKNPYRAFAYLPLCQHKPTQDCSSGKDFTLAFSWRVNGMEGWGAYVKLLFWTDGGNLIGLLPPGSPANRNNQFSLITFMQDDYPNTYDPETMDIQDGIWYDTRVRFHGSAVTIMVNNQSWTKSNFAVNVWAEQNGPQLGVYHFDTGGSYNSDGFKMDLAALSGPGGNLGRHGCEHKCLENGATDTTPRRRRSTTTPAPSPQPTPSGPSFCCHYPRGAAGCANCESQDSAPSWCGLSSGNCGTCSGTWCER